MSRSMCVSSRLVARLNGDRPVDTSGVEGRRQIAREEGPAESHVWARHPRVVDPPRVEEMLVRVDHRRLPFRTANTRSLTLCFISTSDSSL